jgi:hypothetical protein
MERCFVKVAFDPATTGGQVRRAVGGFLRYIQHRDLHPAPKVPSQTRHVAGLVKYIAYRDQASERAELFGPHGRLNTQGRKDFVGFVTRSIEGSEPQIFRTRAGSEMDRRRTVSRFLISPESALGLDLERLTRAAVSRLESEMGVSGLRWIAAIHRNTAHHHVHLVLAGMRADATGGYRRVDITKPRLVAMKEALGLEIERQRAEREPLPYMYDLPRPGAGSVAGSPSITRPVAPALLTGALRAVPPARIRAATDGTPATGYERTQHASSLLALRAVARRYSRQMQSELEREARIRRWERAA